MCQSREKCFNVILDRRQRQSSVFECIWQTVPCDSSSTNEKTSSVVSRNEAQTAAGVTCILCSVNASLETVHERCLLWTYQH